MNLAVAPLRIETRVEVVWAAASLDGEGVLRNLSRSGAWIDEVSVQPPLDARIRVVILDMEEEEREPVLVNGVVVRRSSTGFAVEFDPATSSGIGFLLERLAESDRSDRRWLGGRLPGR